MLDEPSRGRAAIIVVKPFEEIQRLRPEVTPVLLVEQLARTALGIADRGLVIQLGHIITHDTATSRRSDDAIRATHLGADTSGRRTDDAVLAGAVMRCHPDVIGHAARP